MPVTPCGPPSPPLGVTAQGFTGRVDAYWSPPSNPGGCSIKWYNVTVVQKGVGPVNVTDLPDLTSCSWSGLTPGRGYWVRARARRWQCETETQQLVFVCACVRVRNGVGGEAEPE